VINPKVDVVSYGPVLELETEDGKEVTITPDEFVYGAANITYKDTGALRELIDLKKGDVDISNKVRKMLIKVGGSGHASMATTPGFWGFIEGDSSKFVDSIFTTAVFGSSLMPSGRRVPVTKEAIIVPKTIVDKGKELTDLYMQQSEKNIDTYEILQTKGVPKEEAAKIVQYGHKGGGFMFMPLETFIHFSKLSEKDPEAMPEEGKEVISQLEAFIKENGMNVIYEARKQAPRTGCVHPNIFRDVKGLNKNYAEAVVDGRKGLNIELRKIFYEPELISKDIQRSGELDRRLGEYFKKREEMFKNQESVREGWKNMLGELEDIVSDFNTTMNIRIASNIPWRVWGEVKRHRTLSQNTESIYHAVNRAMESVHVNEKEIGGIDNPDFWYPVLSLPPAVKNNPDNFDVWVKEFSNSLKVYEKLVKSGVKESEALAIVPRGIKMMNVKNFDLYNLTTGYMSLRLCGTAEAEMKAITEQEARLVKENIPYPDLISPKCHYVGFCPEIDYQGKKCMKVNQQIKDYNEEMHKSLQSARIKSIEEKL
jgi:thymidylate synthase ThyX